MSDEKLREFARWAILEARLPGASLSGDEIRKKAIDKGLLKAVFYDPKVHGPMTGAAPGNKVFLFTDALTRGHL